MGKVILDLQGTPASDESIFLRHGHGYEAYVSSDSSFFLQLMKELSLWSGATSSYYTVSGESFLGFELDCRDKKFFMSDTFKRICRKCSVELTICEDDMAPLRDFFDCVKR